MIDSISERYSKDAAVQFLTQGGEWTVQSALDVSSQAHAAIQLAPTTRSIVIYVESGTDVIFRFDNSSTDTIEAANGMPLEANELYTLQVPLDIDYRPYVHFKQVTSDATGSIRIVER